MGNLGDYQAMTSLAKKLGGPKMLALATAVAGYLVIRANEAGMKVGVKKVIEAIKERSVPCETKGQVFRVTAVGRDRDLKIRVGDKYRVMECDGDAILIEVLGDPGSPYSVSSKFLRSVSDFPPEGAE